VTWHQSAAVGLAEPASPKYSSSASFSIRERIRNRIPVGPSTEKPAPRPGTTSMVRCVYFQYSNCDSDMKTSTGASNATSSAPSSTSPGPVMNMPTG